MKTFLEKLVSNNQISSELGRKLSSYYVPDLIFHDKLKAIFVLESPHVREVEYGYPLAGNSGKAVAKWISDCLLNITEVEHLALGQLIKERRKNFSTFGILNVLQIPMQASAYEHKLRKAEQEFLLCLQTLRSTPSSKSRRSFFVTQIEQELICSLKQRLLLPKVKNSLLIPCGNVAQSFLKKAGIEDFVKNIPHPSFGQWSRSSNQDTLNTMKKHISNYLE